MSQNLKISELTSGGAGVGSDLIRVARPDGMGGYTDHKVQLVSTTTVTNVVVGNTFNTVELYANGESISNGETATMQDLGYSTADVNTAFPLTRTAIDNGYGTIDPEVIATNTAATMAWSEALLAMRSGASHLLAAGRAYMIGKPNGTWLPLPPRNQIAATSFNQLSWMIEGKSTLLKIIEAGSLQDMFVSYVEDQTAHNLAVTTQKIITGFIIRGNGEGTGTSKGIRLCSSKGGRIYGNKIHDFGIGIEVRGFQTGHIVDNHSYGCDTSFFAGCGDWTDNDNAITISQPYYDGCSAKVNTAGRGFHTDKCDTVSIQNCSTEGSVTAEYGIYISTTGSTVAKLATVKNYRVEQNYSKAAIGLHSSDVGHVLIDTVWSQNSDYLLEMDGISGVNRVHIKNISDDFGKLRNLQSGSGTGNSYTFENVKLPGNPNTVDDIIASTDVWDNTGAYTLPPSANRVKVTQYYIP